MKDLDCATYFLGLGISQNPQGYYLSQQKYTQDPINLVGLTDNKCVHTPLELNVKYNKSDSNHVIDLILYRRGE